MRDSKDEITLVEDYLSVTVGTKFEHHEYTGLEVQPSVRTVWTPNERQPIWAAVSRAVKTPSRQSNAGNSVVALPSFPGGPPVELSRSNSDSGGRNLFDPQHPEATGITTANLAEIPRSFMGRMTWRF